MRCPVCGTFIGAKHHTESSLLSKYTCMMCGHSFENVQCDGGVYCECQDMGDPCYGGNEVTDAFQLADKCPLCSNFRTEVNYRKGSDYLSHKFCLWCFDNAKLAQGISKLYPYHTDESIKILRTMVAHNHLNIYYLAVHNYDRHGTWNEISAEITKHLEDKE